jgi:hypothetical protein
LAKKAAAIAEGKTDIEITSAERMRIAGVRAVGKVIGVLAKCREHSDDLPELPMPTTLEELETWTTGVTACVHIAIKEDAMGMKQPRITKFTPDAKGAKGFVD